MNKKALIIPIIVVGAASVGLAYYRSSVREAQNATLYGNVDIREASLAFRVPGRVLSLQVDEGDRVKPGDILATLDPEPLQISLRASEGAVEALTARNALMHRGYRAEDIEQAKARLQAAQASLIEAGQHLARQKTLAPEGAASQKALDTAQSLRDQAAAQVHSAEEEARLRTTGYRKEEIAESDAQLKQALAQLGTARLALKDAVLTAPSEGVILTRAVEKGSMVQAGAAGFSLTLTRPVWARAYVGEAHLGHFAPGTKVLLHTDSRPDKPYHGIVGFVSPTAEFTPKPVETPDLRTSLVYRLRVVVQDADAQLRQGMPVTLRIER